MEKERKNLHNICGQQGIKRLQKQKQFASRQPCKGCNALDQKTKNKKQKQKQQPTSWIAAVSWKKKMNNKTTAQASRIFGAA